VADKGKGGFLVSKSSYKDFQIRTKAGGKWNTYEITAKGSQLTVVLNGVKTADVQDSQLAQGPFALQFGNGANDARRRHQVVNGADQAALDRADGDGHGSPLTSVRLSVLSSAIERKLRNFLASGGSRPASNL
jgi:hypothetical protein